MLRRETAQYLTNLLRERRDTLYLDLYAVRNKRALFHDIAARDIRLEISRLEVILAELAGESVLKKDVDLP